MNVAENLSSAAEGLLRIGACAPGRLPGRLAGHFAGRLTGRMTGRFTRRSTGRSSGGRVRTTLAWMLACSGLVLGPARADPSFVGDAIPQPLTTTPGDPARGKEVLVQREKGHCILCHALPEGDVRFAGNVGPPLAGVGSRLTPAQIRGRIVDPTHHDSASVMPAYFRTEGLRRVAPPYRGRTVLSAQDVEDAVAYLATLR